MKKYSYPYLFSLTIGFLMLVFCIFWWKNEISRPTYLASSSLQFGFCTSLLVAIPITAFLIFKRRLLTNSLADYLKLYLAINILAMLVVIPAIITVTWILPGTASSYTAPYSYASGGRNSCSGAEVVDPQLQREIRICSPFGDLSDDSSLYVEKKTNALGMVVTFAKTLP